ncbi:hypothetical protein GMA11_00520 [Granulicatella sp. zg-ZJ]|uniref:hypothetical protein n=1 Tax=Granulicatella sp. zg-ZJ TaxID=2678504 RepID=UPI0013D5A466|nr:hypothetical protein [Granulicatella sp. zg-ZJ]
MSVLTESKVRKMLKEYNYLESGIFELRAGEKLTPAAKGFLNDRHVKVVNSNKSSSAASHTANAVVVHKSVTCVEESAVLPHLSKLMTLYPLLLKNQRELYQEYQPEKCHQIGHLLNVIESIVSHRIHDDICEYHETLPNNVELQAIRVAKQLDQRSVMLNYTAASWQLSCYETYIACVVLRKELEEALSSQDDSFAIQTINLLKAIEVLLWLITSE